MQETVAQLGRLDAEQLKGAASISRHFLGARADQRELFKDVTELSSKTVEVSKVRVERARAFGDVCLGWTLWRTLELDRFCEHHLDAGREVVPWPQIASILAIARLCEPSSELHIAEDWYRKTALEDILGVAPARVHHTRLYQGLDQLLKHKDKLQKHIKARFSSLFSPDFELLLYDVPRPTWRARLRAIR